MSDKQKITNLRKYPESFANCRVSLGHAWQPLDVERLKDGTFSQSLQCSRCGTQRVQVLDRNGYVVRRKYQYQDGYLTTGLGRLDSSARAVLRKASVLRLLK